MIGVSVIMIEVDAIAQTESEFDENEAMSKKVRKASSIPALAVWSMAFFVQNQVTCFSKFSNIGSSVNCFAISSSCVLKALLPLDCRTTSASSMSYISFTGLLRLMMCFSSMEIEPSITPAATLFASFHFSRAACNEIAVRINARSVSDRNRHDATASEGSDSARKREGEVEACFVCQRNRFSKELVCAPTERQTPIKEGWETTT